MWNLDMRPFSEHPSVMASAAVQHVIALASQLSEDERRIVVDAIAPKESIAELVELWQAEIESRAQRVRSGAATGAPSDEVFARVEAKLTQR
jgi:anti-sigma-K factor RskA